MNIRVIFLVLFYFISQHADAQEWLNKFYVPHESDSLCNNFYKVQSAFQQYENNFKQVENEKLKDGEEDEGKFKGCNQYKRWEWFTQQRVYSSGEFPAAENYWEEYSNFKSKQDALKGGNATVNNYQWINIVSPNVSTGGSATGMGRINCMTFVPGNPSSFLVGAATGGIWKTADDGATWSCLNTDQLPSLSITDIVINPNNLNEIYVATGDMFAGFPGIGKSLQGHFSAGVLKSSDGGLTWNATGMSYAHNQLMVPQRMLMHPQNDDTLLVASFNGIWRTMNGGATWSQVRAGIYFSMEFNPLNANIVYATDINGLWRSNDCGTTWSWKGGGYANAGSVRVTLAISAADTNIIYLWGQGGAFKKYTSSTNSLTTKTSPDALINPYGLYDRGVAVSPTDINEIFIAGSGAAKSINGGTSWNLTAQYNNQLGADYIHQDTKKFYFKPGNTSTIYALTDGGIFVSANSGSTWNNLSHGIQIAQIYRVANHPTSADTVIIGQQDCATNRVAISSSTITQIFGSDGMQPLYDYSNPQNIFVCGPYGLLQKSTDYGQNFVLASPGNCMWVAPYVMNTKNPQTMYIGAKVGVRKTWVGGVFMSWFTVTSAPLLDSVCAVAVTDADTNVVYAARYNKMIRSDDGGNNWVDITAGLPVNAAAITYITVSSSDKNKVYVAFSGYSQGNKVFVSDDGGANWNNYSGTLPNVPVNCIAYVNNSVNDEIYIGTDFGVFYRDNLMSDWVSFNNGLPNVIVNHLDIFYPTMKIRAGTYGRGLWETGMLVTGYPLPLELVDFSGKYNDEKNCNELQWTTTSAPDISYFEVMKCNLASHEFEFLKQVDASASLPSEKNYSCIDDHPANGANYYRLKLVDFNANYSLSKIIRINSGRRDVSLQLYPNPVSNELYVEYETWNSSTAIRITNALGQDVTGKTFPCEFANSRYCFDISSLSQGVYALSVIEDKEIRASHLFIKK